VADKFRGRKRFQIEPTGYLNELLIVDLLGLKKLPHGRANGAEDASPGQHPGNSGVVSLLRPERAEDTAPLQGGPQSMDPKTQGTALGWHQSALSAPED
jgi:hypothetical protein